jgi:hypothetical protein
MGKREITVIRKKTLLNSSVQWKVYIDNRYCDDIRGGEAKKYYVDENSHTLVVDFEDPNVAGVDRVTIPEGNEACVYHVSLGSAFIKGAFRSCINIKKM